MPDIVIKAENIGKKYVIGHQTERVPYLAFARRADAECANPLGKPVIQDDTI
jgi:hypothetical protein